MKKAFIYFKLLDFLGYRFFPMLQQLNKRAYSVMPTLLESVKLPPQIKAFNFKRKKKEIKSVKLDAQRAESLFVVRGEGKIQNRTVAIV